MRQTDTEQKSFTLAAAHSLGIGDLTLRYGLEGGSHRRRTGRDTDTLIVPFNPDISDDGADEATVDTGLAYVDALYEVTPDLKLEAGLFGVYLDGGAVDEQRLDPRLGVAWTPVEGHYLRAAYFTRRRSARQQLAGTGRRARAAGQPDGLAATGHADTFAARWDAEWTPFLFTALDYQHQDLERLSIGVPASAATIDLSEGRIDRVGATANRLARPWARRLRQLCPTAIRKTAIR